MVFIRVIRVQKNWRIRNILWTYSDIFLHSRRYEQAVEQVHRMLEIDPGDVRAQINLGTYPMFQGRHAEADAHFQKALGPFGRDPILLLHLAYARGLAGSSHEARELLREMKEAARTRYVPPSWIAVVRASIGELDDAVTWLRRAREERDGFLVLMKSLPGSTPSAPTRASRLCCTPCTSHHDTVSDHPVPTRGQGSLALQFVPTPSTDLTKKLPVATFLACDQLD